ncbi:MAG: undecaprenyl-diphosphate phosphatase [Cytophagales bacterium]|nr:undecaprenyl-diphosphate phosphatase [Armatimonadota bacterium]
MDIVKAVTLGIVQGLTEFLPVSSSAHLEIVPRLLGWGDAGTAFTGVVQLGTIAAVILYFRKDLARITTAFLRSLRPGADKTDINARLGWAVLLGTIPICVLGLLFKNQIHNEARNLWLVATMMVVMAALLVIAEAVAKHQRTIENLTIRDGWIVGFAQAIALIPGASRSGSTLTGALFTGLNREAAARFSFLLSIPAILLSGLLELKDVIKPEAVPDAITASTASGTVKLITWTAPEVAIATVVAGLVGYACIAWLLRFLRTNSTLPFVIYRLALGGALFYLLFTHNKLVTP